MLIPRLFGRRINVLTQPCWGRSLILGENSCKLIVVFAPDSGVAILTALKRGGSTEGGRVIVHTFPRQQTPSVTTLPEVGPPDVLGKVIFFVVVCPMCSHFIHLIPLLCQSQHQQHPRYVTNVPGRYC